MTEKTETPAEFAAQLASLLIQGRFAFLQLAQALLTADAAVAGWSEETMVQANEFCNRDYRMILEIFDESGAAVVALVAVSPGGERREIGRVSEAAPGRAN